MLDYILWFYVWFFVTILFRNGEFLEEKIVKKFQERNNYRNKVNENEEVNKYYFI